MNPAADETSGMIGHDASTELSANRTAMSFTRTALSSDRTLMSVVRTSLSLIAFGFTIFEFFHKISDSLTRGGLPPHAPRRFGLALIVLGVIMLSFGILNHWHEGRDRRRRRQKLFDQGLIHHAESFGPNSAMIVAILLLLVGIVGICRVGFDIGPF
jgi:putative membrane protein